MHGLVQHVLESKGTSVVSVPATMSVYEISQLLLDKNIGSVLVIDKDKVIGILHERDIARRVVAQNLKPEDTLVTDIMDKKFAVVSKESSVLEAMAIISRERVRHLPVFDNGQLEGLVSIGDLTKWILDSQEAQINHLIDYISGADIVLRGDSDNIEKG